LINHQGARGAAAQIPLKKGGTSIEKEILKKKKKR